MDIYVCRRGRGLEGVFMRFAFRSKPPVLLSEEEVERFGSSMISWDNVVEISLVYHRRRVVG